MEAVLGVAYGADCEDYMNIGVVLTQQGNASFKIACALFYRQFLLGKENGWTFLAVIDNLACLVKDIDVVGAQCDEGSVELLARIVQLLNSMQHAGRIVHHAIGIDDGIEVIVTKKTSNSVGKARTHEQEFVRGPYFKIRFWYSYCRLQSHVLQQIFPS